MGFGGCGLWPREAGRAAGSVRLVHLPAQSGQRRCREALLASRMRVGTRKGREGFGARPSAL